MPLPSVPVRSSLGLHPRLASRRIWPPRPGSGQRPCAHVLPLRGVDPDRSNNPNECLNREIRRRTDSVDIFSKPQVTIGRVGAVLAGQNSDWAERTQLPQHDHPYESMPIPNPPSRSTPPPTERRNPTRRRHNCDATPQCLPEHAGQLPRKHTPPGNRIATVGDRWQNTGENVSAREPRYRRASSLQTSSIRRPIHEPRRPTVTNVVQTADISAFCRNTRLRWTTFVTHKQKEPLQEHRTKRPDPHVLKRAPRPPRTSPRITTSTSTTRSALPCGGAYALVQHHAGDASSHD